MNASLTLAGFCPSLKILGLHIGYNSDPNVCWPQFPAQWRPLLLKRETVAHPKSVVRLTLALQAGEGEIEKDIHGLKKSPGRTLGFRAPW